MGGDSWSRGVGGIPHFLNRLCTIARETKRYQTTGPLCGFCPALPRLRLPTSFGAGSDPRRPNSTQRHLNAKKGGVVPPTAHTQVVAGQCAGSPQPGANGRAYSTAGRPLEHPLHLHTVAPRSRLLTSAGRPGNLRRGELFRPAALRVQFSEVPADLGV